MKALFNLKALSLNRGKAFSSFKNHNFLHKYVAKDIVDRLGLLNIEPKEILELGAREGVLTKLLLDKYANADLTIFESADGLAKKNPCHQKMIAESEEFAEDYQSEKRADLVVSLLNMHWLNDIEQFLQDIYDAMTNEGVFVANFFGEKTLQKLKYIMLDIESKSGLKHFPHVIPFIKQEAIYRLLQKVGFEFVVVDSEIIDVEYKNGKNLVEDLRAMAETNILSGHVYYPGKDFYKEFMSIDNYTENFEIITVTAAKYKMNLRKDN